ncbi:MAG: hypothetical protein IT287_08925, partial [Bdellovibrionaceae bacterium]|nr:hypothetical protein [Pseudobdellovibrionaceae bacterium]
VDEHQYKITVALENFKVEIEIPYNTAAQKNLDPLEYIEGVIAKRIQQIENIEKTILK